jgi:alpha-glucosidase (family GH31 glycosyl hydrolase)
MHDENDGTGTGPSTDRWQIWKSQRSQDVYRKYALVKTRMLPYVRVAVREARASGLPVMRHLYLARPRDARTYTMQDEYMFGDSLLVAPVVTRGATSRSVYLPEPAYWDYWAGTRVTGGGDITAQAPLEIVPVFARMGAIIPMLSADVETVFPSSDGSVVSMQDRAGFLEVQVFPGGDSSLSLDDGTTFTQSAPMTAFDPTTSITRAAGAIAKAASVADLTTCEACFLDDPVNHVLSVALHTAGDAFDAGPVHVSVAQAPAAKQFVFTIRH